MSTLRKKPPRHVFRQIKISGTIFEKGHMRNNLVKLFQILTSSFGEENFLRFFSYPYSAKSLLLLAPPPTITAAMLFDGSKFCNQYLKGSPKEHSSEIISKSAVSEEKIFKVFLKKLHFVAMASSFGEEDFFKNFFMSI